MRGWTAEVAVVVILMVMVITWTWMIAADAAALTVPRCLLCFSFLLLLPVVCRTRVIAVGHARIELVVFDNVATCDRCQAISMASRRPELLRGFNRVNFVTFALHVMSPFDSRAGLSASATTWTSNDVHGRSNGFILT